MLGAIYFSLCLRPTQRQWPEKRHWWRKLMSPIRLTRWQTEPWWSKSSFQDAQLPYTLSRLRWPTRLGRSSDLSLRFKWARCGASDHLRARSSGGLFKWIGDNLRYAWWWSSLLCTNLARDPPIKFGSVHVHRGESIRVEGARVEVKAVWFSLYVNYPAVKAPVV